MADTGRRGAEHTDPQRGLLVFSTKTKKKYGVFPAIYHKIWELQVFPLTFPRVHARMIAIQFKWIEVRRSCVPRDKARQPSRGRGCAAEGRSACLGRRSWAVGEDPTDCHESGALSRGPRFRLGTSGFAMGRALRTMVFCLRGRGLCAPNHPPPSFRAPALSGEGARGPQREIY